MKQYLDLMKYVLENGIQKDDRTGTGTLSVFGYQMRFALADGFPLVTTKRTHYRAIIHELLWFLRGETNIRALNEQGINIWNDWADEQGELGPIYGYQWRSWPVPQGAAVSRNPFNTEVANGIANNHEAGCETIDQISQVIDQIKHNPDSRRLIVSAWNVADIDRMKLPPCHCFFQFYVAEGHLSCQLYQRSADVFLGVPFNIASYALLTLMVAQVCNLQPGEFVHTLGDAHLYLNHLEQAKRQLQRDPYPLPRMILNPEIDSIFDFTYPDFSLENYRHHPSIKAAIAV